MERPTQAWLDRTPSAARKNTPNRPFAVGFRTIHDSIRYALTAGARTARAAAARRAARCEEANEPQITANMAAAQSGTTALPTLVAVSMPLSADLKAPSWHPELAAPARRNRTAWHGLQSMIEAVAERFSQSEKRLHRRIVTRDPSFVTSDGMSANGDTGVTDSGRKRATR
jgi:hypothetical protein